MSLQMAAVTIDSADVAAAAAFWSHALGVEVERGANPWFASLPRSRGTPAMLFIAVPERKAVKNRVHVDLEADDREAEVIRLEQLGATRVDDRDEYGTRWTVLRDPEGNEFCVAQSAGS